MKAANKGFSLVELAILLVILGLTTILVAPQFRNSAERAKASEAFHTLKTIQNAQQRYHASSGVYASSLQTLQIQELTPQFFDYGIFEAGDSGSMKDSWSLTLTRKASDRFKGEYTVTFTQNGFDASNSTITDLPAISPIQS